MKNVGTCACYIMEKILILEISELLKVVNLNILYIEYNRTEHISGHQIEKSVDEPLVFYGSRTFKFY